MSDDLILRAIEEVQRRLSVINKDMGHGFGQIQNQIDGLIDGVDRKFNALEQDVRGIRSILTDLVQDMKPDVKANREHLLKLERKQEKFNVRLEDVERKLAEMRR